MREQAKRYFEFYLKPDTKGKTPHQYHLQLLEERDFMSDELKYPPAVPPQLSHVFDWFCDLDQTRRNYAEMSFAYAPLSYAEIKSYFDLYRIEASTFEMKVLKDFDAIYLGVMGAE